MADNDFIPPQIRNGGAGPAPTSGRVNAPDYRQVQSAEQIRTDLPDNNAAMRAAALSQAFKEFEGVSYDLAGKAQTQAGALAGAASGATGSPQYKQGLARFNAYSTAFNNAATGAYAVEAEAQADDAAARLRVQANNNPDTFFATYSASRDAVLKNAPPMAVPMLTELYNKRLAAGMAALRGDQLTEQRTLQRQTYDEGVSRLTSRVALLQGSENPQDQLEAVDEHTKLSALITGGVNSGLYSPAEAQAMNISSMRTITAQVFQTQVDRELTKPNGDVITLMDNFARAHQENLANENEPPILSEPEYQKLMADATTKIRERNLLIAGMKRDGKTAEQLRWEAGDQQYTSLAFQGQLTDRLLDAAVRSGDLKPETARTLHGMINGGGGPSKSNPVAYANVTRDPNFLDMTPQDIAAHPDISTTDKLNLVKEQDRRKANWEGTQSVKDAKYTISTALKIPPGTPSASMSDTQRKALGDATVEFTQLMNDIDPAKRDGSAMSVAQTVVKHAAQREAAADAKAYATGKDNFIKSHGPNSASPADPKDYAERLKHYDEQIKQAQAAAKAE
jgi:hypothetical protein